MTWDLDALHERSSHHKMAIANSERVGCFSCCRIFAPSKIKEWVMSDADDVELTEAICPFCSVDSILPGSSVELSYELLQAMERRWFGLRERMR